MKKAVDLLKPNTEQIKYSINMQSYLFVYFYLKSRKKKEKKFDLIR